jgi:hypothetical protein
MVQYRIVPSLVSIHWHYYVKRGSMLFLHCFNHNKYCSYFILSAGENNINNNNLILIGLISRQTGDAFSQPASGNMGVDPETLLLSSVEKVGPIYPG